MQSVFHFPQLLPKMFHSFFLPKCFHVTWLLHLQSLLMQKYLRFLSACFHGIGIDFFFFNKYISRVGYDLVTPPPPGWLQNGPESGWPFVSSLLNSEYPTVAEYILLKYVGHLPRQKCWGIKQQNRKPKHNLQQQFSIR